MGGGGGIGMWMTVNSLAFIRGQTKYWGWREAGVTCATLCKGDHPTSKNEQTKIFFLHACCLCISTVCSSQNMLVYTPVVSHQSAIYRQKTSLHSFSVYQSTIHTQKPAYTSVAMYRQLTDRKPVYTVAVYRLAIHRQKTSLHSGCHVSISNSQTENQFTPLLLCIGWQFTDRNQFTHLLPCIGNLQTENQFTYLFPCIGQQLAHKNQFTPMLLCIRWQFTTVYTAVARYQSATHRQKTCLHICCCVSVNHSQTETSLSICYHASVSNSHTENQFTHLLLCLSQPFTDRNQFKHLLPCISKQLADRKPVYTSVALYQSATYSKKTSLHICYHVSATSRQKTSLHICC